MADPKINVPGMGKVDRKWVIGGGALVAGIVGYAWWRNYTMPAEPVPGEGDLATEDLPVYDYETGEYIGARLPGGAAYNPSDFEDTTPLTNAEWVQRAVEMLSNVGYEPQFVTDTLGKWLSGQPLTVAERILVQAAKGLLGPPPAGDLPIITDSTPPTTPPGNGNGNGNGGALPAPNWQGYRLPHNMTWKSLATMWSASPSPNGVESTKRSLFVKNPTIVARIGTRESAVLQANWIVLVPKREGVPSGTAPPPAPPASGGSGGGTQTVTWQGHRLAANTSWLTLAKRYSTSSHPNAVESTKRAIMARNPTIAARIGTRESALLHKGWIVLIPAR